MASTFVTPKATLNADEYLVYAADNGFFGGVKAALKAGADIDFDTRHCEISPAIMAIPPCTALYAACVKGYVDIVRLLLRKGASMVKRTAQCLVPLHAAAAEGWTEVVELLVQHGATVDTQDESKNTPLMAACGYTHVDTVRRLIELGAKPDCLADCYIAPITPKAAKRLGKQLGTRENEECMKLIQEAIKTKLLRCCNPRCGKPGYRKTLKLCGRCKLTRYCSRDCQIQHWSVGHKKCCGHDVYTDKGPPPFPDRVAYIAKRLLEHFVQG
ncbi:serine/threonine-protein phosphatase 6 regulatory ankyrin repeat subunit B-like [Branchiostoma floridae]|uniref:Serine/threonine-protein phosphatase 6 regulatory ankyrin repeat subunit B-like n=1 Tax=Branchiostoma floridae TaxID=7739 RepID=A0A9J7HRW5_BRAFL|nr:serine/threonine-protein phosphatase 6 regulatory ankyrin repeat subunit B-like [Branchiostoma floridae]